LWGTRESKYERLWGLDLASGAWEKLNPSDPYFMFAADAGTSQAGYNDGFGIDEVLPLNVTGIVTARDSLVIDFDRKSLINKLERFRATDQSDTQIRSEFFGTKKSGRYPAGDTRGWKLGAARATIAKLNLAEDIRPILYRPFDIRQIYYRPDMVDWGRERYMRHLADVRNLGLIYSRQAVAGEAGYNHVLVTPHMFDNRGFYSNKGISQIAPLYLGPNEGGLDQTHRCNFDPKLYAAICKAAGIDPADQAGPGADFRAATGEARPSEVKVFDYIYGVLHSPAYRETFAEFLKIDFPRIPYPASPEVFRHVSEKGEQLRRLHLMEPAAIGDAPYPYEGEGDDVVASGFPKWEPDKGSPSTGSGRTGRVQINKDQYFANVPEIAWGFNIGGYQPAQKWLKDRRGRSLSFEDVKHYQRIIKILSATDRIMKEIELPLD
jgi:predicted helicase